MADCPNGTEEPANKNFTIIVKGCTEDDVKSKLWVDYNLTMNLIRAARVKGCPNDVGRIGFFIGSVTNAGCNCV
jgi:hypothetical protein